MKDHVEILKKKAELISDPAIKIMCLSLIDDMEFSLGDNLNAPFPTMESKVTQREGHSFESATSWVKTYFRLDDES